MTAVRKNIWLLGTEQQPWHPVVLAYAKAVRAMQQRPLTDPRSWRYQAAIHGITGAVPPQGAPWNTCQHATWYFLPWHRMYLHHFEQLVRSFLAPADQPADWALPYWDYSSGAPGNALPPAFREQFLPDGTANPLLVARRRTAVNKGVATPAQVADTSRAMAQTSFTLSGFGGSTGFGGPQTGFAHQGPAFGVLEAQPHGPVHVWVGGRGGLMTDPNTAALDPIFWLHHSNIDRLWEVWLLAGNANPTLPPWREQPFDMRDASGAKVRMRPREVLDTVADLGYTYDSLPAVAAVADEGGPAVANRPRPVLIGATEQPVELDGRAATAELRIDPLPDDAAAAAGSGPRTYLNLADIEGDQNLGVVYGVYLNLPDGTAADDRDEHLAGIASFFGIELSTPAGAAASGQAAHGMRYSFDVTELVDRLRARADWDPARLRVSLHPVDGSDEPEAAAAGLDRSAIRVGTFSVYQG